MADEFTVVISALDWKKVMISLGIFTLFFLFNKLITSYVFSFVVSKFETNSTVTSWTAAFERPMRYLLLLLGFYFAVRYSLGSYQGDLIGFTHICRSIGIILTGWGFYNLSASSSLLLESLSRRLGIDESSMLIPFLSKTIRLFVILLMVTAIGAEWGFSFNAVIAGMGLGSLAVALAAKETLSNILAGIVIIAEKPFSKGDWIMTPSAEGIVEDITFRSSKIRTFADSLIVIPNAILADQPITNWSQMGKRRITFHLSVQLNSNRDRLAAAVQRLEKSIREHDQIAPEPVMVRFNEFSESGLSLMFYFFTVSTVWAEHLAVRQEINFKIMEILEEEGIQLAYPAQHVFLEQKSTEYGPGQPKAYQRG